MCVLWFVRRLANALLLGYYLCTHEEAIHWPQAPFAATLTAPLAAWVGGCHGTTARQPRQWASLHWLPRADLEAQRRCRQRPLLELKPLQGQRPMLR